MLRINGEEVDSSLIEDAFHRIKSDFELQSAASCCERDEEFYSQAEEEVIRGILLAQEAEKTYPTLPPERFKESYENAIKEWRKYGASWELIDAQSQQIRDETASNLRMKLFAEEVCQHLVTADDQMCHDYYHQNIHLYYSPPSVHALHLMRQPDPSFPWMEHQKMCEIREMLHTGSDFTELATKHTTKPSESVDLGWIDMERATNAFESILFSLRIGEVSPVISYENAFHLVLVIEIKPSHHFSLEEKTEEIRNTITANRRRDAMHQRADQLKKTAKIEKIQKNTQNEFSDC